jgi:UDP-2,4-diacetamido-2,4,6-trideoxy-beta-L-altropyranose hydrolase
MSLAHMLDDDFTISFFCLSIPDSLKNEIMDEGWKVIMLETENEFEEYLSGDEIAVLDGYHFDGEYQKKVRNHCHKVISIDDMHQKHFYSDYVLNHCGALDPNIYDKEPYTKLLLGEQYALLRPSFLRAAAEQKDREIGKPYSLFLCMGGSDFHNITTKVLEVALTFEEFNEIHIVLGAANKNKDTVTKVAQQDPICKIHHNLSGEKMCSLMKQSDIAIAPGSSISFEICAVGMGFLSGSYTHNQHDIVHWLDQSGCASVMGNFRKLDSKEIQQYINNLLDSKSIPDMVKNQTTVDGYSGERLLKSFQQL